MSDFASLCSRVSRLEACITLHPSSFEERLQALEERLASIEDIGIHNSKGIEKCFEYVDKKFKQKNVEIENECKRLDMALKHLEGANKIQIDALVAKANGTMNRLIDANVLERLALCEGRFFVLTGCLTEDSAPRWLSFFNESQYWSNRFDKFTEEKIMARCYIVYDEFEEATREEPKEKYKAPPRISLGETKVCKWVKQEHAWTPLDELHALPQEWGYGEKDGKIT